MTPLRLFFLTLATLVAFAANSVLCRLALAGGGIDAASFSLFRLLSGALALVLLSRFGTFEQARLLGNWPAATMLLIYVGGFSFAYLRLETGSGALILFAMVQLSMLGWGVSCGERPGLSACAGLLLAMSGLLWLLLPGLAAPDPLGGLMMSAAGVAWGVYSLYGRTQSQPLAETAGNFCRATVLALPISLLWISEFHLSLTGVGLAVASGALASACGYVLWYRLLQRLSASRAALIQLAVPVLAAFGGVLFLTEQLSLRLLISSGLVLSGIAMAVGRHPQKALAQKC